MGMATPILRDPFQEQGPFFDDGTVPTLGRGVKGQKYICTCARARAHTHTHIDRS